MEIEIRGAMENLGVKLTEWEIKEVISQVMSNRNWQYGGHINSDEDFHKIIRLLEQPTIVEQFTKIYKILNEERTTRIVLYGESGVGKTWIARKIADRAIREEKFDFAVWLYPDRFQDILSMLESVAYQLRLQIFLLNKPEEDQDRKEKEEELKKLSDTIHQKLMEKRVLFIIADEGSKKTIEHNVNHVLGLVKYYKVVITTRIEPDPDETYGVRVMPLSPDESKALGIRKMADSNDEIKELATFFIDKSRRLPSEVITIVKTVSFFGKTKPGLQKLRDFKDQIVKNKECSNMRRITSGYDIFPKSILVDCYSSETRDKHFLNQRGMVYYNELISYWILEGHLGHFTRIEDAYDVGHRILMDLLECGLLKKMDGGYVSLNKGKKVLDLDSNAWDYYGFFKNVRLDLATTFDNKLGANIAVAEGMIKTVYQKKDKGKTIILLLDGNRPISEDIYEGFLESLEEIEVVAIFNPTKNKPFPLPLFKWKLFRNLRLLVIRGCQFLEGISDIFDPIGHLPRTNPDDPLTLLAPKNLLQNLAVFEISGPSFLKIIPNNFFENTPNLKSLNLSFLDFEVLPESVYELKKVEVLILKGCSKLREVKSLRSLEDLQVLDLSGAISVGKFHDKSFWKNKKLQILNLSKSKITRLPVVRSLNKLKSLTLSDCADLPRMCKIGRLKSLQILDISGAEKVKELIDPSLEELKSLKVLDVSRTSIRELPCNVGRPRFLYLRSCVMIKELNPIENLDEVEVLDLSGSYNLEKINPELFQSMKSLRELNLSKTGVKKLENLSSLEKLEVLDLSDCKNLSELEENSFDKMGPTLRSLNVSKTHLVHLPSIAKLMNLNKLYIRCCPNLTYVHGLEDILTGLQILDDVGTVLGTNSDNFNPTVLLKNLRATNVDLASDNSYSTPSQDAQMGTNQCKWSISNWKSDDFGGSVNGVHFLQLLNTCTTLLSCNFSDKFHFLVYPSGTEKELPDKLSFEDELRLRNILYLDQVSTSQEKCLEIRGFSDVPLSLQPLIKKAELLCFVENLHIRLLNDVGLDNIEDMKACWIERCNEMEHVVVSDNGDHFSDKIKNLEFLRIFDVMKMKMISKGITFKSLKFLYLEYCPNLSVICSKSLQLQNLEILEIRYCQALENLFEDGSEAKLENLTKLTLWGLPELEKIDCRLKNLQILRVGECPFLEEIEVEGNGKLKNLEIKFCDSFQCLRTITDSQHEGEESVSLPELQKLDMWGLPKMAKIGPATPNLETMRVVECDMLENVVDSKDSVLKKLKILEVKACERLKTVFQGDGFVFDAIEKVELLCLPELTSIGVDLNSLGQEKRVVWGCPKLLEEGAQPK